MINKNKYFAINLYGSLTEITDVKSVSLTKLFGNTDVSNQDGTSSNNSVIREVMISVPFEQIELDRLEVDMSYDIEFSDEISIHAINSKLTFREIQTLEDGTKIKVFKFQPNTEKIDNVRLNGDTPTGDYAMRDLSNISVGSDNVGKFPKVNSSGSFDYVEGGSGGSIDYNDFINKPQIEGVELKGNQTAQDLGLASEEQVKSQGSDIQDLKVVKANIQLDNVVLPGTPGYLLQVNPDGSGRLSYTEGGSGTNDYNNDINKPQINSVELVGNKSPSDLGLVQRNLGNVSITNPANIGKFPKVNNSGSFDFVEINTGGSSGWVLADTREYPYFDQGKIINLTNGENGNSIGDQIGPVLCIDSFVEDDYQFENLLDLDQYFDEHRNDSLIVVLVPRDGFAYSMNGGNWKGDLELAGMITTTNNGDGIFNPFEKRAISTNILQQPLVYLWNGDERHSSVDGSDALTPLFNQNLLPMSLSLGILNVKYSEITTNLAQTLDNTLTFVMVPGANSIQPFTVQATPQRIAFNVYYYVKKD